ncbi:hypothetical protein DPMN_161160 [Dreissena polymorpha]|uniref:Uncharacterized protein n=1 Tax=Dreissena polymorpha TaxID=45954 RepID=A0A9D4ESM6_DREPO|nr:hypothetical protein DPMN_161160 [Dreissena polymorpha]
MFQGCRDCRLYRRWLHPHTPVASRSAHAQDRLPVTQAADPDPSEQSLSKEQLYVADHFFDREKEKHLLETSPESQCDSNPPSDTNSKLTNGYVVSDGQGNVWTAAVHCHNIAKREKTQSHFSQTTLKIHRSHNHHLIDDSNQHYKHCSPKLTTYKDGHAYDQIVSSSNDTSPCEQTSGDIRTYPFSSIIVFGKSGEAEKG